MPKEKKMGRPTESDKPMDIRVQMRFDKDTLDKLDKLAEQKKMSRSQLVRLLIKKAK